MTVHRASGSRSCSWPCSRAGCVGLPLISHFLVEPYLYASTACAPRHQPRQPVDRRPRGRPWCHRAVRRPGLQAASKVDVYLAGVSATTTTARSRTRLSGETQATSRNWYMEGVFGEPRIDPGRPSRAPASSSPSRSRAIVALPGCSRKGVICMYLHHAHRGTLAFAVLAPVVGCLLAGLDRKISRPHAGPRRPAASCSPTTTCASSREGPCGRQLRRGRLRHLRAACSRILAGGIFFAGGNLLLCVFVITLSSLFFIMAAYCTRSPYAEVGAARETLQVMAYEPMVLFMAVAFFLATGSFDVAAVFGARRPVIATIWLVFLGFLFILTIKLRKSPSTCLFAPRPPGARQGHDHRDERPHARQGGGHALVRERAVPRLGRPVLRVGQPRLHRAWPSSSRLPRTSWRSGSTTTSPA